MRRGFTLIELLVIIAILAILAAILFPVFAKNGTRKDIEKKLGETTGVPELTPDEAEYIKDYQSNPTSLAYLARKPTPVTDGDPCRIVLILESGGCVSATVMIPRGAKVASVQVAPPIAEAPGSP